MDKLKDVLETRFAKRYMAQMVQIEEFVVVFGGIGAACEERGFEVYDLLLDEYHSIPSYQISHFAYWVDTGKIYLHGGFIGSFGRANNSAIEVEILEMI